MGVGMEELKYFDCFAAVDMWAYKDPSAPWTVEQMLADMRRCRIHAALVYSNLAADINPSLGNRRVTELCQQHDRLLPCWVAIPHHVGDFPKAGEFIRLVEEHQVRAVKLFPRAHHFALNERTTGRLLGALEEARIPVCFDCGEDLPRWQQVSWDELAYVCSQYPRLPVILHRMRWESSRNIIPMLQEFRNLHIEFSNYQANRMIEVLVDKVGAEQLLFGTEMMVKSPGAARAYIDYSNIDETDRRKIAGGNIIRLLKLEQIPPDYNDPDPKDAILQKALRAQPIDDMEVIDAHAHQMATNACDNVVVAQPASDTAGIIERNRRIGVDITCLSSWVGIWNDYALGNEITRDSVRNFPQQVVGYATLNPLYVTDWEGELRRCYEEYGMKGMKPYYPRTGIPYTDPRYSAWYYYGNQHRLFALMHWSEHFVKEMEELAVCYPDIAFLLAHTGRSYQAAREYCALAKQYPNIYLEITYTAVCNGIIEFIVGEIGSERVIYGSDTAMRDPFPQFGWVAYADISEQGKRNILGRNMRRILDRCQ